MDQELEELMNWLLAIQIYYSDRQQEDQLDSLPTPPPSRQVKLCFEQLYRLWHSQ